jgi:hypothetical protein
MKHLLLCLLATALLFLALFVDSPVASLLLVTLAMCSGFLCGAYSVSTDKDKDKNNHE